MLAEAKGKGDEIVLRRLIWRIVGRERRRLLILIGIGGLSSMGLLLNRWEL